MAPDTDETGRLRALTRYQIFDTPPEAEFDAFTWLAAQVCATPIAVVSLVGRTRRWFKSKLGIDLSETPRAASFCDYAIEGRELFEVPDALADDRFRDGLLVTDNPHVRFYAAVPLVSADGHVLGNLSVMDVVPRCLLPEQREALTKLAHQLMRQLEFRAMALERERTLLERGQIIAQRDQASQSLRESEDRYRLMVSSVKDYAILMLDPNGNIVTWNAGAERIKGWRADEIIGTHFSVFYPQEDIERGKPQMELEVATAEGRFEDEGGWRVRKDGSQFFANVVITALRDEAGVLQGFGKVTRDVTEKKQAEQALRDSEELFRQMANNVADVFWMSSPDMQTIFYVNPAYERLLGRPAESLYARPQQWIEAIPSAHRDRVIAEFSRLADGAEIASADFPILRPDGTTRWVVSRGVPVRDPDGKVIRLTGTAQDITERHDAQQALLDSQQVVHELNAVLVQRVLEADLANRAKTTFLATMSHELRTPIHGMFGMLELLSKTELNDGQKATLATAVDSGRALLKVIDDILEFSKLEAGEVDVVSQAVSVEALVESVFNMFYGNAISKNLVMQRNVDPRISPLLMADPRRLRQVLGNFVVNAVRFTSRGSVTIKAELIDCSNGMERIRFVVQDTGTGISGEDLQRLLAPLGEEQGMGQVSGTGLGLTISRRLAELMGGSVEIFSTPGLGTVISLTLSLAVGDDKQSGPVRHGASPSIGEITPPRAASDLKKAVAGTLVLVVDDHPINLMLLARQVALLGYCAETAEDGLEALQKWRSGRYGLIITDCDMPRMDGYELTREIRRIEADENLKRTPIVACTASVLQGEAALCWSTGMDGFLAKPTTLASIGAQLNQRVQIPGGATAPRAVSSGFSGSTETPLPIDLSVITANWGSDVAAVQPVLADFRRANDKDVAALRQAVAQGDIAQVGHITHRMLGASRMIGANDFAAACEHINRASRACNSESVIRGMAALEREFAQLGAYFAS